MASINKSDIATLLPSLDLESLLKFLDTLPYSDCQEVLQTVLNPVNGEFLYWKHVIDHELTTNAEFLHPLLARHEQALMLLESGLLSSSKYLQIKNLVCEQYIYMINRCAYECTSDYSSLLAYINRRPPFLIVLNLIAHCSEITDIDLILSKLDHLTESHYNFIRQHLNHKLQLEVCIPQSGSVQHLIEQYQSIQKDQHLTRLMDDFMISMGKTGNFDRKDCNMLLHLLVDLPLEMVLMMIYSMDVFPLTLYMRVINLLCTQSWLDSSEIAFVINMIPTVHYPQCYTIDNEIGIRTLASYLGYNIPDSAKIDGHNVINYYLLKEYPQIQPYII